MRNPVKALALGMGAKADLSRVANPIPYPFESTGLWDWFPFQTPRRAKMAQRVGSDGYQNSAAYAVVTALADALSEPTYREWMREDGADTEVENSDAARLIDEPNEWMDGSLARVFEVISIATEGSAYWHKVRSRGNGSVIELEPLYPQFMKPRTLPPAQKTTTRITDYYEYQAPGMASKVPIPAEDVVQLRWQIDRNDHRLGVAPLREVIEELFTDSEASDFSSTLLTNMGVPGVIISPKAEDDEIGDPDAVSTRFSQQVGGSNRGGAFVGSTALNVQMVAFNPRQMDLTSMRRLPEERVSAALRYPAVLAGLGAGLDRSTFANVGELREFVTETTLVSRWRSMGRQWTQQLLRDETAGLTPGTRRDTWIAADLSDVRALSEDETEAVERIDTAVRGGWAMVSEGRRVAGLPVEQAHEVFLRPINTEAVGYTDDATAGDDGDTGATT